MLGRAFATGLVYALLVVLLGVLYFVQQRMVAARAAVSPTMSPTQQKLMQYLPVVFAVFQVFFLTGLVIYYMAQAIFRIGQQYYITRRFYGHEESLGRQAQRAGDQARELAKADRTASGGGWRPVRQAKQAAVKQGRLDGEGRGGAAGKRTRPSRPSSSGRRRSGRPRRRAGRPRPGRPPARPTRARRRVDLAAAGPRAATNAGTDQRRERHLTGPQPGRSMNGVDDGVGRDDSADGRGGQGAGPRSARRGGRRGRVRGAGEPKPGLFGRLRGEARVRARVARPPCARSRTVVG